MPAARPYFAAITALLLALCVGAVWPVIGMILHSDAAWMGIAAAVVAGFGAGMLALPRAWARAVVALLLTAVSIAYAQYLNAAAVVTGAIGIPFRAVVSTMGPEMAFALARARMSSTGALVMALALVIAAAIAVLRAPSAPTDQSS